tara:strand:+ start:188 stop:427 length:240 start_codon:yes stop_codon:yes gene_type:complete
MAVMSTFYGQDKYQDRKANVVWDGRWYYVEMYVNDKLWESRLIKNHTEQYCEDTAENFVMGIFDANTHYEPQISRSAEG